MSEYAMPPWERRKLFPNSRGSPGPRGYAAQPGTGPAGETCGTCKHHATRLYAKVYHKCGLMTAIWTGGAGTDIRVRSPACAKWEAQDHRED